MNSIPDQTILPNRITATINETGEQIEISDPKFIKMLIELGFHEGRNNSPEDLKRILENVPPQYRQAFLNGFNANPRT
jgi:hypothetical protein